MSWGKWRNGIWFKKLWTNVFSLGLYWMKNAVLSTLKLSRNVSFHQLIHAQNWGEIPWKLKSFVVAFSKLRIQCFFKKQLFVLRCLSTFFEIKLKTFFKNLNFKIKQFFQGSNSVFHLSGQKGFLFFGAADESEKFFLSTTLIYAVLKLLWYLIFITLILFVP